MARKVTVSSTTPVTLTTTTETVVAVAANLSDTADDVAANGCRISGVVNVTAGTAATAVVLRVRAGNAITGALVGAAQTITLAAGASANFSYDVIDPAGTTLHGYCLTLQQTAATGNGTANEYSVTVEAGTY